MKKMHEIKIAVQIILFSLCVILMLPFILINPQMFIFSIINFLNRKIDELEFREIITKEEAKELRDGL